MATTARPWQLAVVAYNWSLRGFIVMLVGSQFLGIIWDSSTTIIHSDAGKKPTEPPGPLSGFNDELYSDRLFVCMASGRIYTPTQLSQVLANPKLAPLLDASGASISGIRVVKRDSMTLNPTIMDAYARICDRVEATLAAIQDSCDKLGYNVTRDVLRVVDDLASSTTQAIERALPILVVPYWDNAVYLHYVIPSWDGNACVFQLQGSFQSAASKHDGLLSEAATQRTAKTEEWLHLSGGAWRNGWYEDTNGQRWFADMLTSEPGNEYGIVSHVFDLNANAEVNCSSPHPSDLCQAPGYTEQWGSQFKTHMLLAAQNSLFVSNGTRYGLFMYTARSIATVTINYSLETFISNISLFALLFRWFVSMATALRSYRRGDTPLYTAGIGCLSSSRTFNILPIMLLHGSRQWSWCSSRPADTSRANRGPCPRRGSPCTRTSSHSCSSVTVSSTS